MSADNYVIVRKFHDGWRWGMFFASDAENMEDFDAAYCHGPFKTPQDADEDARNENCTIEYGVEIDWDSDKQPCTYWG